METHMSHLDQVLVKRVVKTIDKQENTKTRVACVSDSHWNGGIVQSRKRKYYAHEITSVNQTLSRSKGIKKNKRIW